MSVKIKVNMKEEYMVNFMLHHTYTSFTGIAGLIIGIGALGMGISTMSHGDVQASFPMWLIAILFLFISPRNTISRAKQQVKKSEMFKKTLEYEFAEEGITVRQDEAEMLNKWDEFMKVIETKKSVIIYVTRLRAIIFPKECMGEQYQDVVKVIREYMPAGKVKIRG